MKRLFVILPQLIGFSLLVLVLMVSNSFLMLSLMFGWLVLCLCILYQVLLTTSKIDPLNMIFILGGKNGGSMKLLHHFVNGLYCKETYIPANELLHQHIHSFDHLSILAKGTVILNVDGVSKFVHAPAVMTIEANKAHSVMSVTDCVWCCLHATNETDPDRIDHVILEGK